MSTLTSFPIRFSALVLYEMEALVGDIDANAEMDETQQVLHACYNAPIAIRRKGFSNHTYEVRLTVEQAYLFAREVAYYRYHNEECRRECDSYDRQSRADLTRTINACQRALDGANKVLVGAGKEPVTSYWA